MNFSELIDNVAGKICDIVEKEGITVFDDYEMCLLEHEEVVALIEEACEADFDYSFHDNLTVGDDKLSREDVSDLISEVVSALYTEREEEIYDSGCAYSYGA